MGRSYGNSTSTKGPQTNSSSAKGSQNNSRTRPKREKKSRKIFDPADHEFPVVKRSKTGSSPIPDEDYKPNSGRNSSSNSFGKSSTPQQACKQKKSYSSNLCDFCEEGRTNDKYLMLRCSDCSRSVHSSCIDYTDSLALRIMSLPSWQCVNCKICAECHDSNENDDCMLFCDACDLGYHMECHITPLKAKPEGVWECYRCKPKPVVPVAKKPRRDLRSKKPIKKISKRPNGHISADEKLVLQFSSILPQKIQDIRLVPHSLSSNKIQNVPDVWKWTSSQVADYFKKLGFQQHMCNVFTEQDIDGAALCLLDRDDILNSFGLRIGPALKIFKETLKLQAKFSQAHPMEFCYK